MPNMISRLVTTSASVLKLSGILKKKNI